MRQYEPGIFLSQVPYTKIEGVQFYVSEANYSPSYPVHMEYCDNCVIDSAVIDGWFGFQAPRHGVHITISAGATVRNSVIYGMSEAAIGVYWQPVIIENVTILNKGLYNNAPYGIDWSTNGGSGHVFRNVYCGGVTSACFRGSAASATLVTSASSDGTGSIPNVSLASAAFVSTTGPAIDLHIQSASALKDAGTDFSAVFNYDVDGQARSLPWDIGADELSSGGGPPPPPPPPGPTPNEKFVKALYQDLLGRAPSSAELSNATTQLGNGTPRTTIVQDLCSTPEGSAKITGMSNTMVIAPLFQSYLARVPTSGEITTYDAMVHGSLVQVATTILATDEYYNRAQTRF
jgi:hypothetical protein